MDNAISRRALIIGGSLTTAATTLPVSFAEAGIGLKVDGNVTINAAPFTWATVGLGLANGVLGALGARAFAALFGESNSIDLEALLEEYTRRVRLLIRQEIADNERDRLSARAKGLQTLFLDYNRSPRKQLLGDLHRETVLGVTEAERLSVPALASYALCGSLMLCVYQEQYLRSREIGDRLNLVDGAKRLVNGVPAFTEALRKSTEARFGPLRTQLGGQIFGSNSPMGPVISGAFQYTLDGVWQRAWFTPLAQEKRTLHINEVFKSSEKELLSELYIIQLQWARIAKKFDVSPA